MDFSQLFEKYTITLASCSPRRKELLAALDISFTVETGKEQKELYSNNLPHEQVPEFLAKHKSETFHRQLADNEILITADTLVMCDNYVLGKPKDREDAVRILNILSGKAHYVLTGVVIRSNRKTRSFTDTTLVEFKNLTAQEIDYYIDKYKPYDKAGAYGVQEWIGYIGITSISGSYYNVMGLPIHHLYSELCSFIED